MEHIQNIIIGFSYVGIGSAVFAESGLFFGAFLPGDSLLFTVGLLASHGHFHIGILFVIILVAAILGDNVGYAFGKMVGPKIFNKKDSFLFRQSHVQSAQKFYNEHGKKAIILARFVPIMRTFAPIIAGVGKMHYKTFLLYNIIGGLLWTTSLLLLGYGVGQIIPDAGKYLEWIILGIIAVSLIPIILAYAQSRRKK